MAADPLLQEFVYETTCPLCLEPFKVPVMVDCGDNFCQDCLIQFWEETSADSSCPQCRAAVRYRSFMPNWKLAKFVELVKRLQEDKYRKDESRECAVQQEPLKVVCEEGQALIYVSSDKSKEHQDHSSVPTEEASQETKKQRLWLDQLEKLKEEAKHGLEEDFAKMSVKIALLSELTTEIEETCQQSTSKFLQDSRSAWSSYGKPLGKKELDPSLTVEDMHGVVSQKGSLYRKAVEDYKGTVEEAESLEQAWSLRRLEHALETADSQMQSMNKVDVILDVYTAHPHLVVSMDMKDVKLTSKKKSEWWRKKMLVNPSRFFWEPCVLGCEKLVSGVHWWVVEVSGTGSWAVGATVETVRRGRTLLNPEEGTWALGKPYSGTFSAQDVLALTFPEPTLLSLSNNLKKILVVLNYEGGSVDFFDADNNRALFKFRTDTFDGESIRPYFQVRECGLSLKC
ncbi:zinc finger protein RFP-like [Varanus komodoensis]|uniref:zinc finger protein RFP-like n=1 Tax=Varanus komodoensis TaxID=61221 RepID=UPI001CF79EC4|nr:zinc finger protein RFP-like [Varanus komodoensis]